MGNLTFKTNIVPGSTSYGYALGSSTQPWKIYGLMSGTADNAVLAGTADYAIISGCANRAVLAGTANYAQYAGYVNGTLTIGDISYNGTTDTEITIKDLGLTHTMSFLGVTDTTAVYNESTESYIHLIGGSSTTAESGNVVLSKWTGLEYLWSDGQWSELGLATSYALASHIHGNIESEGKILSSTNIVNGTGLTIIEPNGSLNKANGIVFDGSTNNLVLAKSGTWVPASDYILPVASVSTLGGIKIGTSLTATSAGILSVVLSSATNSDAIDIAATPAAVKAAYDLAASKTDTLNTAGSLNTIDKVYLIGTTAQFINGETYSNTAVYMTDGTLNATTFVGALNGTALNALNASTANNAVYAGTAIWAIQANCAIYAETAAYALNSNCAVQSTYAASAGYATTALYCANAGGAAIYHVTATTSWSSSNPYTQIITVPGIKAIDTPIVGIDLSSIAYASVETYLYQYSFIYRCVTDIDQITLYALQKPSVAIPLQLKC